MIRWGRGVLTAACLLAAAPTGAQGAEQRAPSPAEPLYVEAGRLLSEGRPDEAEARLKEALAIDPRHWPSLCRMGEIQAAARRFPEAERSLREAVRLNPDNGRCLSRLAQVLLVGEKIQEAEVHLVRAVELLPSDEGVLFNLARLYDTTERPELAIGAYEKYLKVSSDPRRAASAHLRLGRLLMLLQRPADAAGHLRTALEAQPDRQEVRSELAAALSRASMHDEALAEYEKLISAGSPDASALANAGAIYLLKGDLPRALDLLERATKMNPADFPGRVALGTALAQSGDHARAVEVFQAVTTDDPNNQRAYFLLGQSLLKLGRQEEARQALERHRSIHESIMRERMSDKAQGHP